MGEFKLNLKQEFIDETKRSLRIFSERSISLEVINSLFHTAHNIKSNAKALGLDQISTLSHHAESLLLMLKDNQIELNSHLEKLLFEYTKKMEEVLFLLEENYDACYSVDDLIEKIHRVTKDYDSKNFNTDMLISNKEFRINTSLNSSKKNLKELSYKINSFICSTSISLNKKMKFHFIGELLEVEENIINSIKDPLLQLIKNSCDHAIENANQRERGGKEIHGNIEVQSFQRGTSLIFQITDDGRGIDPKVIRTKAISDGIISCHSNLTDREILQLIFKPGFTTKSRADEISGRGVGMGIVKSTIEGLGGRVSIQSKVGTGSSFQFIFPL